MMRWTPTLLLALLALVFAHGPVLARDLAKREGSEAPLGLGVHFDSVSDALRYNPLLSTLRKALAAADLDDELDDPELVATILTPTDAAFSKLLKELELSEQELFDDRELLSTVLKYHIIPDEALKVNDINDGDVKETLLEGHSLTFHKSKYLYFLTRVTIESDDPEAHDATVSLSDIEAANSVIHVINHVLVPSSEEQEEDEDSPETVVA